MFKFTSYFIIYLWLCTGMSMAQSVKPVISDQLYPAQSVQIEGYIGKKFDASYDNRVLAQDADRLVAPFMNRTETSYWQSEFWGKWFTSAVLAYKYKPGAELKAKLNKAVNDLIATQTTDGYIGNYADDKHLQAWDIWGRKYCMLGLIAWYDISGEKKALDAAGKVAVHLKTELDDKKVLIVKLGNHRGMAASSVLEPLCLLYARTCEKRFLDFAEEIVRQWETSDGPQLISKSVIDVGKRFPKPTDSWYGWEQGQKAYEMMSCYEGLLELYRLTGKNEYLNAAEKTWKSILDTEINYAGSGSAVEAWFGGKSLQHLPINHYQETCVTVTWIKFSQQLLRLTGDSRYADVIEQAFYNALLGSMKPDGSDWAKYTPLSGQRLEGSEQCGMGLNCCSASGPRGLFTIPLTAVMQEKEGVRVNFYIDGKYNLETPKKTKVDIAQETQYPVDGKVVIKINLQKPEDFTVRLRIPEWSKQNTVTVNGEPVSGIKAGEYLSIGRKWKAGDQIEIDMDMRARKISAGKMPMYEAIVRGPILLSRDARLGEPEIESVLRPVADKDGYINLEPVRTNNSEIWMAFKAPFVPESYTEGGGKSINVVLCDYASAGNSNHGHPHFRVWLPQLINPQTIEEHY
jgi:Uncharacterized protein conserved in bacteria